MKKNTKSIYVIALGLGLIMGCSVVNRHTAKPERIVDNIYLEHSSPYSLGMDGAVLAKCDSAILKAIEDKNAPGAVLCVVKGDKIVYENAYGNLQLIPKTEPMTVETIFDLASLSKCFGTSIAVMQLVEQKKIKLDDPVDKYLPGYKNWQEGKKTIKIRIRDLMTHTAGLASYIPVDSLAAAWGEFQSDSLRRYIIEELPRGSKPGTKRNYSCPSFVSLQYIVESVTGQMLCDYVQAHVFDPLELEHTTYLPLDRDIPEDFMPILAPTEVLLPGRTASNQIGPDTKSGEMLKGQVHDPLARRFNAGNSGNAGIFSCADDLAVFCAALMNGGEIHGRRILKAKTVKQMFKVQDPKIGRTLGWDSTSPASWIVGDRLAKDHCICHTGYTGTSVVMDLDEKLAIILLTNNSHPFDKGNIGPTRKAVSEIVGEACGK